MAIDPKTSYAIAGMDDADPRKHLIAEAVCRLCDGCGATVWLSEPMIPQAEAVARQAGRPLYIVCFRCGRPYLEMVDRGQGTAHAVGREASEDLLDRLRGVRTDRLRRN